MSWFVLIILSLIEGLTEFLPISSTGHLILASAWLGINEDQFVQSFNIIIQFGAILSVLVLYWRKFFPIRLEFYKKIFVAFLPAAVLGFLLKSVLEKLLGSVLVVGVALFIGGIVLIMMDRQATKRTPTLTIQGMTLKDSLILGFVQCLALIPGVSRAGATILGGMGLKLSREEATEFSFFLAVPTLTAAAAYKTLKIAPSLQASQFDELLIGTILSFVFALLAIKFFIGLVKRFGLQHFGWYRIALGLLIFLALSQGWL
ncbi:MAG: undecaprenyl-diphosphatase UppP [Bdellovibrio sp.]|jgi:undecaprenyl-diphosphatase